MIRGEESSPLDSLSLTNYLLKEVGSRQLSHPCNLFIRLTVTVNMIRNCICGEIFYDNDKKTHIDNGMGH